MAAHDQIEQLGWRLDLPPQNDTITGREPCSRRDLRVLLIEAIGDLNKRISNAGTRPDRILAARRRPTGQSAISGSLAPTYLPQQVSAIKEWPPRSLTARSVSIRPRPVRLK